MTDRMFNSLRTWAKIDLDAIRVNHRLLKSYLPPDVKTAAVIKADAYGHGALRVARLLENEADYFAVAMVDEAVQLRMDGIKKPILILGHTPPCDYRRLLRYNIETAVSSIDEAEAISGFATSAGGAVSIHIALDTGMSRIGFSCCEKTVAEIRRMAVMPGLKITGIFSHYAAADEADLSFMRKQTEAFSFVLEGLRRSGIEIPIRHMCNSAASLGNSDKFDMIREGIILYGIMPSDEVHSKNLGAGFKPAMELKTHVSHIRRIPEGTPVSYGCTYVANRETVIATLQAGYADGVPRLLSNRGSVLIRGKRAPIAGRICMDQMMVDVTDIDGASAGDTATIFGVDGDAMISADEVARLSDTIGYEIICGISKRVPRVYIEDGNISGISRALPYD